MAGRRYEQSPGPIQVGNPTGTYPNLSGLQMVKVTLPLVRSLLETDFLIPADFQTIVAEELEIADGNDLQIEGTLAIL